jgi:hypothetical protein
VAGKAKKHTQALKKYNTQINIEWKTNSHGRFSVTIALNPAINSLMK